MNGLRCPKCELVNLLSAKTCHRCGASLSDLPSTAKVSVPVDQTFQAMEYSGGSEAVPEDNELGRKTFFWYRIYCGVLLALYVFVTFAGIFLAFAGGTVETRDPEEAIITGVIYAVLGAVFAIIYAVALFLPRKPFNWVVGIIMIAIGLTSCCFLPATVPLLIFWLKPETKAYFGKE